MFTNTHMYYVLKKLGVRKNAATMGSEYYTGILLIQSITHSHVPTSATSREVFQT